MYALDSSSYEFELESMSTLSSSLDSIESLEGNYSYFSDDSISDINLIVYQDAENPDKVLLNQLAKLFNNAYRRFEQEIQELQGSELSDKRFKVLAKFIKDLEDRLLHYLP